MQDALGEAGRRYARLQAPDCTEAERVDCLRWRRARPEHERAFQAVERFSRHVEACAESDPYLQYMAAAAYRDAQAGSGSCSAPRSVRWWAPALAASFMAVMLTVTLNVSVPVRGEGEADRTAYVAGSEPRRITLDDGSRLQLDVGSEAVARFTARARHVELLRGRAVFTVAPDTRAFTVTTPFGDVVALGTRFEVRLEPGRVAVTLEQGSVEVAGNLRHGRKPAAAGTWRASRA